MLETPIRIQIAFTARNISAIGVTSIKKCSETQRLVWVYTYCICSKVPFRMTLVICEKVPYCGTNIVILDQLFLHVCDGIYDENYTWSQKNVFCKC